MATRPRRTGFVLGERTISVTDRRIYINSAKAASLYYWSASEAAAVTEHLLVLFLEPAVGLIIPRRGLHPEDLHALVTLIRQQCSRLEADLQGV